MDRAKTVYPPLFRSGGIIKTYQPLQSAKATWVKHSRNRSIFCTSRDKSTSELVSCYKRNFKDCITKLP